MLQLIAGIAINRKEIDSQLEMAIMHQPVLATVNITRTYVAKTHV